MGVIPLKGHHSPVNYFRITFLSASSEKNVWVLFCVHEWGRFIWNTNLLHVSLPSLLQIWDPYVPRVFFSMLDFLLQKMMCPAVCSGCRASYVDSPDTRCQPGTGLPASSRNLSNPFIQNPSHDGSECQEVPQHTAVDTVPLFKHYRSDSHLLQNRL